MGIFRKKLEIVLVFAIPILSFVLGIFTVGNYGINWDEPYHYRRGQAFLHYYLTGQKTYEGLPKYPPLRGTTDTPGFRNSDQVFEEVWENPSLSNPEFRRSYYQNDAWNGEFFIDMESTAGHPALNDILASLSNKIFYQTLGILGDIESYHLFIISVFAFAVFFIAAFMWREFGVIESVFTSLTLTSFPLILGEQHFNIKDPVEASLYGLTIISAYLGVKKDKLNWLLLSTLFFALALSTKFNIVFVIPTLAVWFFLIKGKISKNIRLALLLSPIIILGIFILSNPPLWKDPLNGFSLIVKYYLGEGYSNTQGVNYYLGFINTYPLLWITFTTFPIVLGLILAGVINIQKIIKANKFVLLVVIWGIITIGRISLFGASSYGGARLIMEYIPAFSIFAGISAGYLIKRKKIFALIILLGFIPSIVKLVQIHPNENVYFNALAGGLAGAKEKNLDSWGNSYGNAYYPALIWLNENGEKNARLTLPVNSIVNIPRFKLRSDISLSNSYWSGPRHEGEYVLELTHDYPPKAWYSLKYLETAMTPVYEVRVDGVAIAKLWKNDPEFVKEEYESLENVQMEIKRDNAGNRLILTLPEPRDLMQISLSIPKKDCSPIKTGFVQISTDGINWIREPEDIARDQLKQASFKGLDETFDFYFVAKKAKIIVFEVENSDACLLKTFNAEATVLQDP